MQNYTLRRIFLYGAALLIVAVMATLWLQAHDRQRFSEARLSLLDSDFTRARLEFESLRGSWLLGADVELGSAVTRVVAGTADTDLLLINRHAESARFHLDALLFQRLRDGDYQTCLKLSQIAGVFELPTAPLYRAAALTELRRFAAAEQVLASESLLREHPLYQRLQRLLELIRSEQVERCIYDRHGRLIAGITASDEFIWSKSEYESAVQPVLRNAILRTPANTSHRLAIDLPLSQAALDILGDNQGSIVVLRPGSNDLLAAVSDGETSADPRAGSSPAFEQQLEPASISKLITTVAALRSGVDPDQRLRGLDSRKAKRYDDSILWNPANLGIIKGLNQAMAGSCNISFAELGIEAGWQRLAAELRRFGFDRTSGNPFDLGHITLESGNQRELADLAIGLEHSEITPLHSALVAAVFANNGEWLEPRLIIAEDGLLGLSPQQSDWQPAGRRVVERDWLPILHDSMRAVTAWGGTARGISPRGLPVAMKTGTGGGEWEFGFHINYIGFAPVEDPLAIFAVRITNERRSFMARRKGFQTTRSLLTHLRDSRWAIH